MKFFIFFICLVLVQLRDVLLETTEVPDGETSLHFQYKTENGQKREEAIKFNKQVETNAVDSLKQMDEVVTKPVEYRGGYSFISADGYEYTVKYKANKNGFQPFVTARKLTSPPASI